MKHLTKASAVRYLVALGKTAIVAAAALAAFTLVSSVNPYSLSYNISESIPKGLYLLKKAEPGEVKVGDIGCFLYSAPDWAKDRNYFPPRFKLCKPVFAGTGAQLEVREGSLYVAQPGQSSTKVASFNAADSLGRPLPPALASTQSVPQGYFLMLAPVHNNSLDSRYLGLILVNAVRFKAHPLITW